MAHPPNRIFYAAQAVGLRFSPSTDVFNRIHGLQTVGMNTNFNLDTAYQMGNIELYANIEGTPEVEVTLEKVIDGHPLIIDLATPTATGAIGSGSVMVTNRSLVARSNSKIDLLLTIQHDGVESVNTANAADNVSQCLVSGAYLSQISYKMPLEGNMTESATIVGNTKIWSMDSSGGFTVTAKADNPSLLVGNSASGIGSVASGVARRQQFDATGSTFPNALAGMASNAGLTGTTSFNTHLQNVNITCNLGREALNELGRKIPYFRFVKFPVEVTSEFEVLLGGNDEAGDFVNATEGGLDGSGRNLLYETIVVKIKNGPIFNLGTKNMLTTVNYQGGGIDGSNATATYSFRNFNNLLVSGSTTIV